MLATDVLKNEHRAVERVLRVLQRAADKLDAGENVPPRIFSDSLDFLRNFADRCHHTKEETLLFPALEKAGVPRESGPVGVMLVEHEHGRERIRAMMEALEGYEKGDAASRQPLAENARAYAALLGQHIQKEDSVLFAISDRVLPADEHARLVAEFERVEQEHIGAGEHERYHQMIDELERWA